MRRSKMSQSEVYDSVFLENTRLVYSGVHLLLNLWSDKGGDFFVSTERYWDSCFPDGSEEGRRNNPLRMFFEFLKDELVGIENNDEQRKRVCQKEAAQMTKLLHDCIWLQTSHTKELYPNQFEAVCDSMRDIMNSQVCYLLYSQRDQTQLLSMSSFPENMVFVPRDQEKNRGDVTNRQLNQEDFDEIRTLIQLERRHQNCSKEEMCWSVAGTLYAPVIGSKKNVIVMVLDYPKYPKAQWNGEWIYVVFQYNDPVPERASIADDRSALDGKKLERWRAWNKLLIASRNVLFLRHNILNQCIDKLYILLTSQRSYQYVWPIDKGRDDEDKIKILHLTDLHLQRRNIKQAEDFLDGFRWKEQVGIVDLVVITGDIVQGNASAGMLEENYRMADGFIRNLAVKLWKNESGYVRADWQKRIIIIPGNHDYASMNELQSMSIPGAKRATGLGYPARQEGGPMVKFAYYIRFVCGLLGLDMNEMIANDLNELRCYRQLKLAVYAINTVSEVGPYRTNKVLLDMDILTRFSKVADSRNQFPLLLCHHTPNYTPKYLLDRYEIYKDGLSSEEQEKWIEAFVNYLKIIHTAATDPRQEIDLSEMVNKLNSLKSEIMKKSGFDENNPEAGELLWDVERTINSLMQGQQYSEQIAALHQSLVGDKNMSERDARLLREGYEELLELVQFRLALGGHRHELKMGGDEVINQVEFGKDDLGKIPFVEGDRMLKDNAISFGLVTIDHKKGKISWHMKTYPEEAVDTRDKNWEYRK